jgi:hypothetical protein
MARRLERGEWASVLPGVYRTAGAPATWHQMLLAGCLWAGDAAVVSHVTAARLHALEGMSRATSKEPIELTVPFGTILRAPGFLVHRSRRLERSDRTVIDGIPATSFARTLTDIAPLLDEKRLSVALDSGLARNQHIDVHFLRRQLRRLAKCRGTGARLLGRLLDARAPDAVHMDSALERRFLVALRCAGLPRPVEHHDVFDAGRHLGELDFAYPRARVGIELNGGDVHRRPAVLERDQERWSELAIAGWCIVLVTWAQLERDEDAVMDRVKRALAGALPAAADAAR